MISPSAYWMDDMKTPQGTGRLDAAVISGGIGYVEATKDPATGEITSAAEGSLALGLDGGFIVTYFQVTTGDVVTLDLGVSTTANQCQGRFDTHYMTFTVAGVEFKATMVLPEKLDDVCTETSESYTATVAGFYGALVANNSTADIRFDAPSLEWCEVTE